MKVLLKEFIKLNANMKMIIKNVKQVEISTKTASTVQESKNVKDDSLIYKYLFCNRNYQKKFGEDLNKRFANPSNIKFKY